MLLKNMFVYPRYPENLRKLIHLAYNLWTLWDAEGIKIFFRIDPTLFRSVNLNPIASVSCQKTAHFSTIWKKSGKDTRAMRRIRRSPLHFSKM
jgi:hypothetical protein